MNSSTPEQLAATAGDLIGTLKQADVARPVSGAFRTKQLPGLITTVGDLCNACALLQNVGVTQHLASSERWSLREICQGTYLQAHELIKLEPGEYAGERGAALIEALHSRAREIAAYNPALSRAHIISMDLPQKMSEIDGLIRRLESKLDEGNEFLTRGVVSAADSINTHCDSKVREAERMLAAATEDLRVTSAVATLDTVEHEFARAAKACVWWAALWGTLGGAAVIVTLCIAFRFLAASELSQDELRGPDGTTNWYALGPVLIRIAILSTFLGLTTFLLRPLKAYMHMHAANRHRQRVANRRSATHSTMPS